MYEHGQSNVSIISEIFIAPVLARKQLSLSYFKREPVRLKFLLNSPVDSIPQFPKGLMFQLKRESNKGKSTRTC